MQLPGLIQFRKCTLTDKRLAESVAAGLVKMYQEPASVPTRHIPARPDEDFDLLVGEMVVRFLEKTDVLNSLQIENSKITALVAALEEAEAEIENLKNQLNECTQSNLG